MRRPTTTTRIGRTLLGVALAGSLLALTACSSGTASTAVKGTYDEAALQAIIDEYTAIQPFEAPGESIDIASLAGEEVMLIPTTTASEIQQEMISETQAAAKAAGIKLTVYSNTGIVSEWQQGFNQAIQQDLSAIIFGGAPELVAPQLEAAEAAGIPVISQHYVDASLAEQYVTDYPGLTAIGAPTPHKLAMQLSADYVALKSEGKAHIAFLTIDDMGVVTDVMVPAFMEEITKVCPDCVVKRVSVTAADAPTKTPTAIQAALQADPEIDWIVPMFDAFTAVAIPGLELAGATETVQMTGFNGITSSLDLIASGDSPMTMDVGEPALLPSWSSVDQTLRILLGEDPVEQPMSLRVWDASNIAEAGSPAVASKGYGAEDVVSGYKTLWGVK